MYVSIANSKLKSEQNGFRAEDSAFLEIGTNCTKPCNDFTCL